MQRNLREAARAPIELVRSLGESHETGAAAMDAAGAHEGWW
jgi:hypothetical protein